VWLEDFDGESGQQHLGLALAAITAFTHGDDPAVEAVMAEVSDHPLEMFITQTGLAATLIDVLASATQESAGSMLECIALMLAHRGQANAPPFP
jgi:hypothetical protein